MSSSLISDTKKSRVTNLSPGIFYVDTFLICDLLHVSFFCTAEFPYFTGKSHYGYHGGDGHQSINTDIIHFAAQNDVSQ